MFPRVLEEGLKAALGIFPVVGLLGPRQVGKTTLALEIAPKLGRDYVYLDLERDSDLNKLSSPELYLGAQAGKLVVLDEIQRKPQLFPLLRSLVDERIRAGEAAAHFLVLGSARHSRLITRNQVVNAARATAYVLRQVA